MASMEAGCYLKSRFLSGKGENVNMGLYRTRPFYCALSDGVSWVSLSAWLAASRFVF